MGACCCCCGNKNQVKTQQSTDNSEARRALEELKRKHEKLVADYIVSERIDTLKDLISKGFKPDMLF